MIIVRTDCNRFASILAVSLTSAQSREIGWKLLQRRGSLSFFNIRDIVAWRNVGGSMPDCYDLLNTFSNHGDNLSAKVFKNSAGKWSGHGHFPFCIDIRAHLISPTVKGSSSPEDVSGSMDGMFKDLKKFSYCVSSDELSEVYKEAYKSRNWSLMVWGLIVIPSAVLIWVICSDEEHCQIWWASILLGLSPNYYNKSDATLVMILLLLWRPRCEIQPFLWAILWQDLHWMSLHT